MKEMLFSGGGGGGERGAVIGQSSLLPQIKKYFGTLWCAIRHFKKGKNIYRDT